MEQLRAGVACAIGGTSRQRVLVAHSLNSHCARCANVLIEERRCDLQCLRDVIETIARLVARQQLCGVDVDAQQITHGVGVFLAIEPVQAYASWQHMAFGGIVE